MMEGRMLSRSNASFRNAIASGLMILASIVPFQIANAQDSWSDSDPKVMSLVKDYCPLKVRGKSGEWANFKNDLPVGKKVVGAINPRRPDIIFFQLKRDSKFMFAAPRTCFEGEQDWNVRVQEEAQGFKSLKERYSYFTMDFGLWKFAGALSDGSTTESLKLSYKSFGLGFDWAFKQSESPWYLGLGVSAGMGQGGGSSNIEGSTWETEKKYGFHGLFQLNTYYSWKKLPFALGLELFAGAIKNKYTSNILSASVTPSVAFLYGAGLGGIIRMNGWKIHPKVHFPGFKPKHATFQLLVGVDL